MLIILVGHRGVGKTHLLKRIQRYRKEAGFSEGDFFDLDQEISLKQKLNVEDIFSTFGESSFRQMEEEILFELVENLKRPTYIALGAGYEKKIPKKAFTVWIRRETDSLGRIFLDRPRLNPEESPLEEFFSRMKEREERYQRQSQGVQLMLREGDQYNFGEKFFFLQGEKNHQKRQIKDPQLRESKIFQKPIEEQGLLTLQPNWMKGEEILSRIPVKMFELRDDWLTKKQIKEWRERLKDKKILFSFRSQKRSISLEDQIKKNTDQFLNKKKKGFSLKDWALELGPVPDGEEGEEIQIVSLHEGENLKEALKFLETEGRGKMLKFAPLVKSFSDLLLGFQWQQKDPKQRSFLPRSNSGRWRWFRLFMKYKMPLNFFRLGAEKENLLDQPSFLEWMNVEKEKRGFAAVLGKPIQHSRSVTEHEDFFRNLQGGPLPFYAIEVGSKEFKEALFVLIELGLKAAAVTSPLKQKAFESSHERSLEAQEMGSLNTLFVSQREGGKKFLGHNTDFEGLRRSLLDQKIPEPIAVWGGGGTLPVLKKIFSDQKVIFFSARSGKKREKKKEKENLQPKTLVWASGPFFDFPKENYAWPLELVIDLSYTENSLARQVALYKKCTYISGLKMFEYQAEEQRCFWNSCFEKKSLTENEK